MSFWSNIPDRHQFNNQSNDSFAWLNENTDSERWFFPDPPVLVTDLVFVPPDKAGVAVYSGVTIIAGAINPIAGAVVGLLIGIFGDKGSVPILNVCGIQTTKSEDIYRKYAKYFGFSDLAKLKRDLEFKYETKEFKFLISKDYMGRPTYKTLTVEKLVSNNYFANWFLENLYTDKPESESFDDLDKYLRKTVIGSPMYWSKSYHSGTSMFDKKPSTTMINQICLIWFLNLCCQTKFNSFDEYVSRYHEIGIIDATQVDNAFGQPVSAQPVDTVQDGLNNLLGNIDAFNIIKKYWYLLIIALILIFKKK